MQRILVDATFDVYLAKLEKLGYELSCQWKCLRGNSEYRVATILTNRYLELLLMSLSVCHEVPFVRLLLK